MCISSIRFQVCTSCAWSPGLVRPESAAAAAAAWRSCSHLLRRAVLSRSAAASCSVSCVTRSCSTWFAVPAG
jgi:hypothetical protein